MDETDAAYLATFLDGPATGRSERRALVEGASEPEVDVFVAVEGIETRLTYRRVDERSVDGGLRADYRFDAGRSDPIVEDREDGSGTISEVV